MTTTEPTQPCEVLKNALPQDVFDTYSFTAPDGCENGYATSLYAEHKQGSFTLGMVVNAERLGYSVEFPTVFVDDLGGMNPQQCVKAAADFRTLADLLDRLGARA